MEIVVKNITRESLGDIPRSCKECLYWELPEDLEKLSQQKKSRPAEEKKKEWFIKTLDEFGNCGKIVYQDKAAIGYAQYAPFNRFPQVSSYKSGPCGRIEECTVLPSCSYISEEKQRGKGIGAKLLDTIITDSRNRGFKAVETFARRRSANNPSGRIELYLKRGFKIKDETNPEFPLLRLELWYPQEQHSPVRVD
jgi:GNAT superfamily N-acetyltransferase